MASDNYFLTSFLPWLDLPSPARVLNTEFVPFGRHESEQLAVVRNDLRRILSGYVDIKRNPVSNLTIVFASRNGSMTWELSDDDHDIVATASSFLMLAAFAKNEYFKQLGGYVNSAVFDLYWQKFNQPAEWMAIQGRRRDGGAMDMGYRHGEIQFSIPAQLRYTQRGTKIDQLLLDALSIAHTRELPIAGRIEAALTAFRVANTDSPTMSIEQEIVWMASAFEQILDANSNADDVARKFEEALGSYGTVTLADALSNGNLVLQSQPTNAQTFVHQFWIKELYTLRSMAVHGNSLSTRANTWSIFQHLVMAAFAFPLLAKVLLRDAGAYELTANDEGSMRAVDKLLTASNWHETSGNGMQSVWNEILDDELLHAELSRD